MCVHLPVGRGLLTTSIVKPWDECLCEALDITTTLFQMPSAKTDPTLIVISLRKAPFAIRRSVHVAFIVTTPELRRKWLQVLHQHHI